MSPACSDSRKSLIARDVLAHEITLLTMVLSGTSMVSRVMFSECISHESVSAKARALVPSCAQPKSRAALKVIVWRLLNC
jgi:hypothetical protein